MNCRSTESNSGSCGNSKKSARTGGVPYSEAFAKRVYWEKGRASSRVNARRDKAKERKKTCPIREQGVAHCGGDAGGVRDAVPPVWFLRDRAADVVIAEERRECGELHPPIAKFFIGVPYCRTEKLCGIRAQAIRWTDGFHAPKPQASAPTIGIWKSWNCSTPWMLW